MVTARQRPETANGITFMLLEDERGSVNLIVPPPVYDRHRTLVRTAPLLRARGRLERREGTINVLVADLAPLERVQSPDPKTTEPPAKPASRPSPSYAPSPRQATPSAGAAGEDRGSLVSDAA